MLNLVVHRESILGQCDAALTETGASCWSADIFAGSAEHTHHSTVIFQGILLSAYVRLLFIYIVTAEIKLLLETSYCF